MHVCVRIIYVSLNARVCTVLCTVCNESLLSDGVTTIIDDYENYDNDDDDVPIYILYDTRVYDTRI